MTVVIVHRECLCGHGENEHHKDRTASCYVGGGYSEHSHNADSCEGCVDERPNMSHHGFLSVEDATDYLLRDCLTFCDHSANPKWSGIHEWSCFVPAPIEAITDGKVFDK